MFDISGGIAVAPIVWTDPGLEEAKAGGREMVLTFLDSIFNDRSSAVGLVGSR